MILNAIQLLMKKEGLISHFKLNLPTFMTNNVHYMEFDMDYFYLLPSVAGLDIINKVHRLVNPVAIDR